MHFCFQPRSKLKHVFFLETETRFQETCFQETRFRFHTPNNGYLFSGNGNRTVSRLQLQWKRKCIVFPFPKRHLIYGAVPYLRVFSPQQNHKLFHWCTPAPPASAHILPLMLLTLLPPLGILIPLS